MCQCEQIKDSFLKAVSGLDFTVNGDPQYCLPSTINISFHGVDAEGIFVSLKDDYALSNGSACTSRSHEPSYVLRAMGIPPKRIDEAIRISWGYNTAADFSALVQYINLVR